MAGRLSWLRAATALGLIAGLIAACGEKPRPSGGNVAYWEPQIQKASKRFNVPPEWIREVMRVESAGMATWKGGKPITSSAGAQGLMQVMPGTYAELADKHGLGSDPYDPEDNIMAGTAYIRQLYDMYGSPGFLAAYNAGPGRYKQYVEQGRPLPPETRRYMDVIGTQIAGVEPGSSRPDRMTQYAEQQIRQKTAPVMASMQPIPDATSPEEQATRQRVEMAIAGRTGQPMPVQPQPVPQSPVRQPTVVAMQPIPDRTASAPAPVVAARPAPVRMAPIPDQPAVGSVDDVLLSMAASEPERPAPSRAAPVVPVPAAQPQATRAQPARARPAPPPVVAPTRAASAAPARAPAAPRRQDGGLPSGWYVPSAPGG